MEVELSLKAARRLVDKLTGYSSGRPYDRVIYLCGSQQLAAKIWQRARAGGLSNVAQIACIDSTAGVLGESAPSQPLTTARVDHEEQVRQLLIEMRVCARASGPERDAILANWARVFARTAIQGVDA